MTVRLGIDDAVDQHLLQGLSKDIEIVRVPEDPGAQLDVDFWVPAMPPRVVRHQWQFLRGVRVVQLPWAGVDTLVNFFPRGVTLCDARGVHDIPTAEWAAAVILAMQKSIPYFLDRQRAGVWALGQQANQIDVVSPRKIKNPPAPMREIADSTVLIVGYGAIGHALEQRLSAFGAHFLRVARTLHPGVQPVSDLDKLLPAADVVLLTLPLTSETRKFFGAEQISRMKSGALLVNASRGAILDTDALLVALESGKIRAALDVTDPEPLPHGHPLWKAPNILITPHVGGDSERFFERAYSLVRAQVERFARGEELGNVVRGEY